MIRQSAVPNAAAASRRGARTSNDHGVMNEALIANMKKAKNQNAPIKMRVERRRERFTS